MPEQISFPTFVNPMYPWRWQTHLVQRFSSRRNTSFSKNQFLFPTNSRERSVFLIESSRSFRVGFIYIQKLKDYLDYSTLLDKLQVNNFAFPRVSPTLNLSVMPADTKYAGTHIIQGRICAMWSAGLLAIFMPA